MKKRNATGLTSRSNNARKKEIAALKKRVEKLEMWALGIQDWVGKVSRVMIFQGIHISYSNIPTIKDPNPGNQEKNMAKKKGTKKGGKKGSC